MNNPKREMAREMRNVALRLATVLSLLATLLVGQALISPTHAADDPTKVPLLKERTSDSVVTADPLASVQLDGTTSIIWGQALVGNTVYAGGSFANVHPAGTAEGTNLIPRANLLAYDITDGSLKDWAPSVNGIVKSVAASPDGQRIYVGGSFTVANGVDRYNLAAFDASTGALITAFNAAVGGSVVNAIATTDNTVYVGGLFSAGNNVSRQNLAAFSAASGALLGWAPTTNHQIDAMVMDPTTAQLIIGGRFDQVNNASQRGMAALHLSSGATLPWAVADIVINGLTTGANAGKAGIFALTADDTGVYGTGWVLADTNTGNLEGVFAAEGGSGSLRWIADCHGDHYGVFSDGKTVYTTSHEHSCDSIGAIRNGSTNGASTRHATAMTTDVKGTVIRPESVNSIYKDWSGNKAPAEYAWYPEWLVGKASSSKQAGWSIVGNDDFMAIAGEFIGVNNKAIHGIARFTKVPANGPQSGPRLSGSDTPLPWTPTAKSTRQGAMLVSIPANRDRDGKKLTYEFRRVGQAQPFATVAASSQFWHLPTVSATDTGVSVGESYSYQVRAIDSDGNVADSAPVTATATNTTSQPTYAAAVVDDGPLVYWRLGNGSTITDTMGTSNGTSGSSGPTNATGAVAGDTDRASTFAGNSNSQAGGGTAFTAPASLSYELWFKTDTTTGGELVGLGNAASGNSTTYDRAVYMSNNGRLNFASYFGVWRSMTTTDSFNDNAWHHLVVSQGLDGATMYVDGKVKATDSGLRYGRRNFSARLRVAGDITSAFPNAPSSQWFKGTIDDVSVYPYALTKAQTLLHRDLGVGASAPAPMFSSAFDGTEVQFDASATTVSSGRTVASYAWDFGDGATGAGVAPTHTYSTTGTYTVTLTVTDSAGSEGVIAQEVLVHLAPTADFDYAVVGLDASFDPSTSTATGGATISGYLWNFGDGNTSTEEEPIHAYAAGGTYDVSLTVTDSLGSTSSVTTKQVTVEELQSFAADAFDRTVGTGWGDADTGGAWSGTAGFSVAGGVGLVSVPATVTHSTTLPVSIGDATARFTVGVDKAIADGTAQVNYVLHKSSEGDYRVKLRYLSSGQVAVWLTKSVGPNEALLAVGGNVNGFTQTAGAALNVKVHSITSGGSTTLRTKVWPTATTEPISWMATATDSEAALQGAGEIGLSAYANGSVSNAPLSFSFDNLNVSGEAVPDVAPVARFTHTESGLRSTFDSSTSTASGDATITGYAWDFGDGASGTQASPSHRYDAAGTYTVSLVVTDSRGVESEAVSKSVTVTHADPTASFLMSTDGLGVATDASASEAADGATLSYEWSWGDGSATDSGVNAAHTYADPGTYSVRLTVTDSLGSTDTDIRQAEVAAVPNAAPVARFTHTESGLRSTFDSSTSTASGDATITGYAWDFGDGASGTQASPSHRYDAAGTYTVSLVVTDSRGVESEAVSKSVTVTHADPTASFLMSTDGLGVATDASASEAADGATLSYEWSWGDGSATDSGVNAAHTYADPGTYSVRLTVTDSLGSTDTATKPANVASANPNLRAFDAFGRTVGTGWGDADTGGAWSGTAGFSVAGGVGLVSVPATVSRSTTLPVSIGDATATFTVGVDKAIADGTAQVNYVLHKSSAGDYRVKLRYLSSGQVAVWLTKKVGNSTETLLANGGTLDGFTQTDGAALNVKVNSATTGGSTTLRTKVWPVGTSEPTAWKATATDSEAALQGAGEIGLGAYANGAVSNAPLSFSFDNLNVVGEAAVHEPPSAKFTVSNAGLRGIFDGTGSTASGDATITAYAWTFGDGSGSAQASPSHDYASAGTYDVTLRVTDSKGAVSDPLTKSVSVAESLVFARDAFGRTVGTGWGDADTGGAWSGTAGFSVAGGVGLVSVPATVSRSTTLPVSIGDATATFTVGVDKAIADGTAQVNYVLHKSSAGDYRVKLRYLSSGQVAVWLTKKVGNSTETLLANGGTLDGFTQTDGAALNVKVNSATTGGSTTLRTKVWPVGTSEPTAWKATATDSEAALQGAGEIGLGAYANGAVSNAPLSFSFDNLNVD